MNNSVCLELWKTELYVFLYFRGTVCFNGIERATLKLKDSQVLNSSFHSLWNRPFQLTQSKWHYVFSESWLSECRYPESASIPNIALHLVTPSINSFPDHSIDVYINISYSTITCKVCIYTWLSDLWVLFMLVLQGKEWLSTSTFRDR